VWNCTPRRNVERKNNREEEFATRPYRDEETRKSRFFASLRMTGRGERTSLALASSGGTSHHESRCNGWSRQEKSLTSKEVSYMKRRELHALGKPMRRLRG
jgi:hypothetical protein